MRKTIAKALTWRLIGTAEIFSISFWTTGHIATAGHTAGIAAISSVLLYVLHELVWDRQVPSKGAKLSGSLCRDAANCITRWPKREHDVPEWRAAIEALMLVTKAWPPNDNASISELDLPGAATRSPDRSALSS